MLRIENTKDQILSINLHDILSCIESIEEYNWKILWLTAVGKSNSASVLDLEEKINNSETGYPINSIDLLKFNSLFSQIIEIVLIGDKDNSKLKKYADDAEMISACVFCIELVDSSYWEINSQDEKTLNKIRSKISLSK